MSVDRVPRRETTHRGEVCCFRSEVLVGGEHLVIELKLLEQSFEFEFLEHYSDAAHNTGVISYNMISCAENHVSS